MKGIQVRWGRRALHEVCRRRPMAALAKAYYGSHESWNLRDRHMVGTLERLLQFYGPSSKAVVWAHNSHVGDASATDMAARGELNVGQLCRRQFGEATYIIGFGTDHGTVAAASYWDGPLPLRGSRLIDKGSNAVATAAGLTTDQRGLPRLSDGDGSGGAIVDQGAVEFVPAGPANIAIRFVSHLAPAPGDTVVLGIVIRAPGRTVVGGGLFFDGFDVSEPLVGCPLVAGTLVTGEQVITCSFPASVLPPGVRTFSLFLNLDDGTTLSDTAIIGG